MRRYLIALLVALAQFHAPNAAAQERSGTRPGFVLQPGSARILMFRPDIVVGAQSTGGMFEPNADWTAQARENLGAALDVAQIQLGNEIVRAPELVGESSIILAEYRALFTLISQSIITYQFFPGNRLPTKIRPWIFDWSMGIGISSLSMNTGCDYALFIFTKDHYGSTGRKIFQILASLAYIPVKSGEHMGFAGLVDLRTGDLLWLNADLEMGGDVRTPEGAQRRVSQLLENFPGRGPGDGASD